MHYSKEPFVSYFNIFEAMCMGAIFGILAYQLVLIVIFQYRSRELVGQVTSKEEPVILIKIPFVAVLCLALALSFFTEHMLRLMPPGLARSTYLYVGCFTVVLPIILLSTLHWSRPLLLERSHYPLPEFAYYFHYQFSYENKIYNGKSRVSDEYYRLFQPGNDIGITFWPRDPELNCCTGATLFREVLLKDELLWAAVISFFVALFKIVLGGLHHV